MRRYKHHTYKCRRGHASRILVEQADALKPKKCKTCRLRAEHIGYVQMREAMQPTVIAVNKEGKKLYLGSKNDPVPKGYEKREILPSEIRAFEREINREMREEHLRTESVRQEVFSEAMKRQVADLKSEMRRLESKGELSEFDKELAQYAIEQMGKGYSQGYDPEFRIQAFN